MDPIHDQKQANKFLEGGIFYPTGHVLAGFATQELASESRDALQRAGFSGEKVLMIDAATMAREARENLASQGLLSFGASLPTRQKQLDLAEQGVHFILVHAPGDEDHDRVIQALDGIELRYAVKYHTLIIENLVVDASNTAPNSEPARVP